MRRPREAIKQRKSSGAIQGSGADLRAEGKVGGGRGLGGRRRASSGGVAVGAEEAPGWGVGGAKVALGVGTGEPAPNVALGEGIAEAVEEGLGNVVTVALGAG